MTNLLTCIWTAMELVTICLLWNAFFQPRVSKWKYILAVCTLLCFFMVYFCTNPNQRDQFVVTILSFCAVSLLVNQGRIHWHLLIALLGYCTNTAFTNIFCYGVSALLGISVEALIWRKTLFILVVSAANIASILLAWYIRHIWKGRKPAILRGKWLLLTALFLIVSAAMLYVSFTRLRDEAGHSPEIALFSILLFTANISFFYLADSLARSTEKLKEAALLSQQLEVQTQQILALEKSYHAQRTNVHDFRNQLQTIMNLMAMDKIQEAKDYAQNLLGQHTTRIFAVNSGHPVIDAILNFKYQCAREQGIDMHLQINDMSPVELPADMLVVLLSNLLDNAIEGCCRIKGQRKIECKLLLEDALFLCIKNTSLPVKIQNGRIPTSKTDKESHGYGLGRIAYILDQLESDYTFTYCNGWFTYTAEIPLKNK